MSQPYEESGVRVHELELWNQCQHP